VIKFANFFSFLYLIGGQIWSVKTANRLPHTYPFAHPRAKFKDKSNHEHNILRYMAYMKAIPTHSLYKWDCWHWLTCFLELLKSGIVLETKSSSQFRILATWSFLEVFFSREKHSSLYTPQLALSNHSTCMHPYQGIAMLCLHLLLKRFMWSFT
jgi:hypothetical protein